MRRDGFTLIEVLVALTILGIVLAMLAGTFQMAIRTWQKGDEIVEEHEKGGRLYEQFAQDLRSAFYSVDSEESFFVGESHDLRFVCTSQGPISPYLAWRQVFYFIEEGKGLSMREDFPEAIAPDREEPRPALVLDSQVAGLSFHYLGFPDEGEEDGEWTESWDSLEKERLPQAVQVVLRYGQEEKKNNEGEATRSFTIYLPVNAASDGEAGDADADDGDGDDVDADEGDADDADD